MQHATRSSYGLALGLVACLLAGCDSSPSPPENGSSNARTRRTITNKVASATLLAGDSLMKVGVRTALAHTHDGTSGCDVEKALIFALDGADPVEMLEDELIVKLARIARSGPHRVWFRVVDGECIQVTADPSARRHPMGASIAVAQAKKDWK